MGIIQTNPGSPLTIGGGSGNKIYGFNNITTATAQVVAGNSSRQSITFHNPGDVDIFIAPLAVINTGSQVNFTPTTSALGGTFRVFANGGALTVTGECQCAWQAFSASGSGKPLTIMESNV